MTAETKVPEFEGWAVVELMGHRRQAGYVREASMFGTALLRLDVPSDDPATSRSTHYYGGGSIYALTPCTEEIARSLSKHARETPEAIAYALPEPKGCDARWRFDSPCSPDITPTTEDDPLSQKLGTSMCGRHRLEYEKQVDEATDGGSEAAVDADDTERDDELRSRHRRVDEPFDPERAEF